MAQLYLHGGYASVTRQVRELKGFERIHLEMGETKTLQFTLTPRDLSFWDANLKRLVEPGTFSVMVSGSQDNVLEVALEVIGNPK